MEEKEEEEEEEECGMRNDSGWESRGLAAAAYGSLLSLLYLTLGK